MIDAIKKRRSKRLGTADGTDHDGDDDVPIHDDNEQHERKVNDKRKQHSDTLSKHKSLPVVTTAVSTNMMAKVCNDV